MTDKTPLGKLIESIEADIVLLEEHKTDKMLTAAYRNCVLRANLLLPEEKQAIVDAFREGQRRQFYVDNNKDLSEVPDIDNYFTQKYKA